MVGPALSASPAARSSSGFEQCGSTQASEARWERLAECSPRLRTRARIHRHTYRGAPWYVIEDTASGRHHRVDADAHRALRLMDGRHSAATIAEALEPSADTAARASAEVAALLELLDAHELIDWGAPVDAAVLEARGRRTRGARRLARLRAPHVHRFALLDPRRLLGRGTPLARALFSPAGLAAWTMLVAGATALAAAHWAEMVEYVAARGLAPQGVIIAYLLYAAVKAVHEASHALAVRRFGGEVREMGVMLLLLLPLPYVDASAATGFRDKPARMLVGAAGIMAELALAAVATVVWLTVETGVTRDLAMGVMLIGSVSTLLFNGNPLLRFDGYHVLADLIEIPNLGSRSGSYYVYLAERHLLGRRDARSPVRAPGERVWFLGYGLASNAYRISVTLGIALLVAAQFQALGVLLALWVVAGQIVYPVVRALVTTARAPWLRARRARAVGTVGLLGALAVLAVAVLPVPLRSSAQGIVWIPDEAQLRASVDGFVTRVHVRPGEPVRAGQALLEIEEPLLEARAQALEWQVRELTARRDSELGEDAVEAALIAEELRRSRDELAQLHTEIEGLTLRGASGGTFVAADGRYLPGRHVSKGEVLGYVLAPGGSLTLRVAVDQATWELVGRRTESVRVMLVDRPYEAIEAQVLRVVPSAGSRLPSRALGRPGGGAIRVDARAAGAASPLEKVFVLDLEVAAPLEAQRLGLRGHVRFAHGSEPLAPRWYRAVRRLLLRRLAA